MTHSNAMLFFELPIKYHDRQRQINKTKNKRSLHLEGFILKIPFLPCGKTIKTVHFQMPFDKEVIS